MQDRIRLPPLQDIGRATAQQFGASLMPRDSLRQARTSQSLIATGPLKSIQRFVVNGAGAPNSPEAMSSGLMISNAKRLNKQPNRATSSDAS